MLHGRNARPYSIEVEAAKNPLLRRDSHCGAADRYLITSPNSLTGTVSTLASRMTRATRFASYASAVTLCYFLAWFSIIPIPFIEEETKEQIIPLVRTTPDHKLPGS